MDENEFIITSREDMYPVSQRVIDYYKNNPGLEGKRAFKVTIEDHKPQRSLKQNKYFYGVVIARSVEFYRDDPKGVRGMLEDVIRAWCVEATVDFIDFLFRALFNRGKTHKKMSTKKFEAYILKIRQHMFDRYELDIPEPNEEDFKEADEQPSVSDEHPPG